MPLKGRDAPFAPICLLECVVLCFPFSFVFVLACQLSSRDPRNYFTMRSLLRPLVSLLSFVTYVQCVTLFVYPGNLDETASANNNQVYKVGDSINVKWRTDVTSLSLGVSQILANGSELVYMIDCE